MVAVEAKTNGSYLSGENTATAAAKLVEVKLYAAKVRFAHKNVADIVFHPNRSFALASMVTQLALLSVTISETNSNQVSISRPALLSSGSM